MSTRYYNNCPYCGRFLNMTYGIKYNMGNPLRPCPQCGKQYVERHCYEYAVAHFYEKLLILNAGMSLVITFPLFLIVSLLLPFHVHFLVNIIIALSISIPIDAVLVLIRRHKWKGSIDVSKQNCMNKQYVLLLDSVMEINRLSPYYLRAAYGDNYLENKEAVKLIKSIKVKIILAVTIPILFILTGIVAIMAVQNM